MIMATTIPASASVAAAEVIAAEAAKNAASTVATETVKTVILPRSPLQSFVSFTVAFVLGGLFFSTVLAGIATFMALGKENLSRLWSILRIVVQDTWAVFITGLKETKAVLRLDGKSGWKWRDAWNELRRQLGETRKAAVEGVEAIRLEATMYSAAVGKPGLIPLQYVIDRLTPYVLKTALQDALQDTFKQLKKNVNIRRIELLSFAIGDETPELLTARMYDVGNETMAFDVDMKWDSKIETKVNVITRRLALRIPVIISDIAFNGCLRVQLTPLVADPPGYGAAIVSFPTCPKINMSVRVAGAKIDKVPWLKTELLKEVEKGITEQMLWPKRTVVPALNNNKQLIISPQQLEELNVHDPFSVVEAEMMTKNRLIKRDFEGKYYNKTAATTEEAGTGTVVNVETIVVDEDEEAEERSSGWRSWRRHIGNWRF